MTATGGDPFNMELPDFTTMNDGETLTWLGTDAVRWARAFDAIVGGQAAADDDRVGTLHVWFANALEAGRGQGQRELGAAINLMRTQEMFGIDLLGDLEEVQEALSRAQTAEPGPSLEETEPALISALHALFDDYGAEGVRRTVVKLQKEMVQDAAS